ncbi:MAG: hypothetical protein OES38_19410, partial [Gammaproteobacteria bacterium]|nr:hypothetical protein [Gammaproteobacteria bacterium]
MSHAIWAALTGSPLARACTAVLLAVLTLAVIGPSITGWSADQIDWNALEAGPSADHWFGTDLIGRDLFT